MENVHYQKRPDLTIVSKKGLELVSGLQHWAKNMSEMFVRLDTNTWPNFIFTETKSRFKRNTHITSVK